MTRKRIDNMNNIDFRRHYILMIDTETANSLNDQKED